MTTKDEALRLAKLCIHHMSSPAHCMTTLKIRAAGQAILDLLSEDADAPQTLTLPDSPGLWWRWANTKPEGFWEIVEVEMKTDHNIGAQRLGWNYLHCNANCFPSPGHWIKITPPPPPRG